MTNYTVKNQEVRVARAKIVLVNQTATNGHTVTPFALPDNASLLEIRLVTPDMPGITANVGTPDNLTRFLGAVDASAATIGTNTLWVPSSTAAMNYQTGAPLTNIAVTVSGTTASATMFLDVVYFQDLEFGS